jgi:anthraniloyl-CoA monooxygenase
MFTPFRIGELTIPNRVVLAAGPDLEAAAQMGAGLVITEFVSVTEDGRITPETPVIDRAQQDKLRSAVEQVHRAGSRVALQLGHAGRRGSMRPRSQGVDRPLRKGWRLLAASPIAYTPHAALPKEMTARDIAHAVKVFAAAATAAAGCGLDALELNFAHGYLVAGFISPLTNRRTDEYGGLLENRMRFPLQVLEGVRAVWKQPLLVRISAGDWAEGGTDLDEVVSIAALLKAHGCDLLHAVMGQTIWESRPDYRRLFGVPAADRIRNEGGIPAIASGNITTSDEVNTILAAGRADLCVLEVPATGAAV